MERPTRRRFLQAASMVTGGLLLSSSASSAASCESDGLFAPEDAWPAPQGTAGRTRATKAKGPSGPYLETQWTQGVREAGSPTIANGVVYFSDTISYREEGAVQAYDIESGKILWTQRDVRVKSGETVPIGAPVTPPVAFNNSLYFAGRGEKLQARSRLEGLAGIYALDAASGEVQWLRSDLTSRGGVEVIDGNVYFERGALDAATGETIWEVDESGELLGVAGNLAYFSYWDRTVERESIAARDTTTGKEQWRVEHADRVVGTAATSDTLYVTSKTSVENPSYAVYALSGTDGSVKWRSSAPIRGTAPTTTYTVGSISENEITVDRAPTISVPAVDESRAYVLTRSYAESWFPGPVMSESDYYDSESTLYAFDRSTGEEVWRFETPIQAEAAPTVADGIVYFVGNYKQTDAIYALDAETGKKCWLSAIPNHGWMNSSPTVVNNSIFTSAVDPMVGGKISKFESTECGESVPDKGARTVRNDSDSVANQTSLDASPASQSASSSSIKDTKHLRSRESGTPNAGLSPSAPDKSFSSTQKYDWRSPLTFIGGLGLSAGAYLINRSPLKGDD
ncbi:PQQ-binding-like beta-propeller repeat protein [Halomicrococcus sp. NG-SE-24]|uniref:outer membrane protein assembly factor BamB family protein n=1 Tax=Halomicrococcus sp. NG-SE-24 TaxID=3436928 RepID=UPI003D969DE2